MITEMPIYCFASTGDGLWSSSGVKIADAYDPSVSVDLGSNRDSFSFKLNNPYSKNVGRVKPLDLIQVGLCINGEAFSSSCVVITGLVKSVEEQQDSGTSFYLIQGASFSDITLNALVFYEATNISVRDFIIGAVNSVELRNTNFGVTVDWTPTTRTGLGHEGTPFPSMLSGATIKEFDRSLDYILQKYLQDQYTQDGRYYYYINSQKQMVIRRRANTTSGVLTEGVGLKSGRWTVNIDDVKNFIVVKCGNDAYNKPITTRYDDPVSRAKYGFRYYMIVDTKISSDLLVGEGLTADSKFPSSYPYTTKWGATVHSDNEFNDALRAQAKVIGQAEGQQYAAVHSVGLRTLTVKLGPTRSHQVGDMLLVNWPSYQVTNLPMRIQTVKWDINNVTLTLNEEVTWI